jgi:hypothetical protein
VYACRKYGKTGMTITNQNYIHREMKGRLDLGIACYYSAEDLFSSHLLFKTVIFPVVLYGYEVWFLTLSEEHNLECLKTGC